MNNFGNFNEIKNHSIRWGGVTSLWFSLTKMVIYSAGGDGSIFVWSLSPKLTQISQLTPDLTQAELQ